MAPAAPSRNALISTEEMVEMAISLGTGNFVGTEEQLFTRVVPLSYAQHSEHEVFMQHFGEISDLCVCVTGYRVDLEHSKGRRGGAVERPPDQCHPSRVGQFPSISRPGVAPTHRADAHRTQTQDTVRRSGGRTARTRRTHGSYGRRPLAHACWWHRHSAQQ